MKEKIRIHSHPAEEAEYAIHAAHCIIDRKLFDAIREKYGEYFDPALPVKIVGCNCAEHANRATGRTLDHWWICPQHGYKRF